MKNEITGIEQFGPGESGNGVMIELKGRGLIQVCNTYMKRYSPEIGGYLLESDEGFLTYEKK